MQLVPERVQNRTLEQIVDVPVPQIKEGIVAGVQHVPQERVQNLVEEQIGCVPVPRIKEDVVDGIHVVPQEPRKKRVFLDWPRRPASQPNTGKVKCTGKVFTVKMRHHRGDQACAVDTVGLNIKGLNKYNMPQSGDVMVLVPQIQEQNVDVGGQEQVIVREIPEVLAGRGADPETKERSLS